MLWHEWYTFTMDLACALTAFDAACSITDVARKTDATLTLGGRHFGFGYSLSRHHNAGTGLLILPTCHMVVSFLLLDVSTSCESMNVPGATRKLLRRLSFHYPLPNL